MDTANLQIGEIMNKIFTHFTIKGDELDIVQLIKDVPIDADVYKKDELYPHKFNKTPRPQTTNRWVYSLESKLSEGINDVISKLFKNVSPFLTKLNFYTKKFYSNIDIVIYLDDASPKVNLNLSKKSITILHKLNSKISITFFDF